MKRKPPVYVTPKIRTDRSGLTLTRGFYKASYTVDGKRRVKSLGTKDLATATRLRDEFYASLGCSVKHGDGDRYVYHVNHYEVNVRGHYVGTFKDRDEAINARDAAVKELG